jgi:hypothetical protein
MNSLIRACAGRMGQHGAATAPLGAK